MSFSTACKVATVTALEREVKDLTKHAKRVEREYGGRKFVFFEHPAMVIACAGIGLEAARRAAEAVIALYHPTLLQSVGFAGALRSDLRVGDMIIPAVVLDARDGSRVEIAGGNGVLLTFMEVAGVQQKLNLAQAYGAQAVDMEAAAVAAAARAHGIAFRATKVISDGLDFSMPETARFIDANGHFRTTGFAAYAALRPWLWLRVVQLASNSRKARKILCDYLTHQLTNGAMEAKTTEVSSNS
jgi:adenosylhomocysteine nucleosidase